MWTCTKCGAEVPDEYEVCFKCGNIKLVAAPENTQNNTPASGKGKKGKGIIAVISAVLIVAVLLSVSMVFHFKAAKQLDKGNYHQAIELAGKDFLFGSGVESDARKALGDKYMSSGDYEKAAEQFELMGKAGHEAWVEAVKALAEQKKDNGSFEEAIELYESIADEEGCRLLLNEVRADYALSLIEEGSYDEAVEVAETVESEFAAQLGVDAVYNEVNFSKGRDCLLAQDFAGAMEFFGKCGDYGSAKSALKAAELLNQSRYYESSEYANKCVGDGRGRISAEDWQDLYIALYVKADEWNKALNIMAALKSFYILDNGYAPENVSWFYTSFPEEKCPSGVAVAFAELWAEQCDSELLAACGANPDGRVLIVFEINNFVTQSKEYAIAWELMDYLPEGRFPYSLDSVEYIVRISYDRQSDGWYNVPDMGSVNAFQEYVKIFTERANPRETLAVSQTVWGEEAPSRIYLSDIVDNYISGGAPAPEAVAESFCQVMREVLAR